MSTKNRHVTASLIANCLNTLTVKFALKAAKIVKEEVPLQENQMVPFFIFAFVKIFFCDNLNNCSLQ